MLDLTSHTLSMHALEFTHFILQPCPSPLPVLYNHEYYLCSVFFCKMEQGSCEVPGGLNHRIIESPRLEKTHRITQSNHPPITNSSHYIFISFIILTSHEVKSWLLRYTTNMIRNLCLNPRNFRMKMREENDWIDQQKRKIHILNMKISSDMKS